jgi:uncharacterized RDD family membrane protein YckC
MRATDATSKALAQGRGLAFFIDLMAAGVVQAFLVAGLVILPASVATPKLSQTVLRISLATFLSCCFLMVRDLLGGRSLGKRILGLEVRSSEEGNPKATSRQLLVRNLILFWPLDAVSYLIKGQRVSDRIAHTKVVRQA